MELTQFIKTKVKIVSLEHRMNKYKVVVIQLLPKSNRNY